MNSERPTGRRWSAFYRYQDAVLASDVSHAELRVALVIARCANVEGLAWPSLLTIQERCARGRSTVLGAIKTLEAKGWLTVEHQGARAKFLGESNRYRMPEQFPSARPVEGEQVQSVGPDQVQDPGPDGDPDQVRGPGPDRQVQDPGLLRSRIAHPSGPGSDVFAALTPFSGKEPVKEPERGAGAEVPGRAHAPAKPMTAPRLPVGLAERARALAVAGYERRKVAPNKACRELTSPVWADIARFGRDTGALRGVTPESVIRVSMRVFFEDERMRSSGWPIGFLAQNGAEFFNRADHNQLVPADAGEPPAVLDGTDPHEALIEPLRAAIESWARNRKVAVPREAAAGLEHLALVPVAKWLWETGERQAWDEPERIRRCSWLIERFYTSNGATAERGYPLAWLANNPAEYALDPARATTRAPAARA